ncbi:hypothetical protein [Kribbella sp. NBC_00359]|uniref:hypothetical protein n=1 Tax=Kribbella sp. NBC_00359 TaxID=2975966 RepID=UPI002E1EF3B5
MAPVEHPVQLEVDGELFEISPRPDQSGAYDYRWLSGSDSGYGFSAASSDRTAATLTDHEQSIRDFLSQVAPKTGHIE